MPIYEYRRPDGTTFEVLQKMTDEVLTTDPETGVPVERVVLLGAERRVLLLSTEGITDRQGYRRVVESGC